ncbi:hypothetical protein GOP47_0006021 [Adiantum capillus-veneris]|uniref:Pectate lyase n=1 Tax=Adiantum capillus-veneris TaxID=13818 RepID=A0A9D4V2N3_ADICA|nr:hypothetical protein GOP47_0006021 [Adiantum capillus-veneris]
MHAANMSALQLHRDAPLATSQAQLKTRSHKPNNHSYSKRQQRAHKPTHYLATSCATGNTIDDCWRCDPYWQANRKRLADCAIGFGRDAIGGKHGQFYVVTDADDDNPVTPRQGTLRHAVIQSEPLWIVFASDMTIRLKEELIMNSYKTIDGRGHDVHIAGGPCITIQYVSNIIIHGIHVHDCKQGGNALVRSSPTHYGWRTISDGDGISLFGASHVWIDHCSLSRCTDGLIDAIMGSTAITISNSYFSNHDKVMLLGHSDAYVADKTMQVTIAFNHFGEGLVQRMPRCRHGFFEVVNNDYTHWEMYAIGGSAAPTINSKGNRYTAPANRFAKSVTMRIGAPEGEWERWDWRSEGDMFVNGAYFTPSGAGGMSTNYEKAASIGPKSSSLVSILTANAGVLSCKGGSAC